MNSELRLTTRGTVACSVGRNKIAKLYESLRPVHHSDRWVELASCLDAVITHYDVGSFVSVVDAFDDLFPEFSSN